MHSPSKSLPAFPPFKHSHPTDPTTLWPHVCNSQENMAPLSTSFFTERSSRWFSGGLRNNTALEQPSWDSCPTGAPVQQKFLQLATIHSGKGTLHSLLSRVLHHPSHCCHHFLLPFFLLFFFLSLYLTMWPLYSPCWPITHSRDYIGLQIIEIQLSQPPFTGMKGVHHI